MVRQTKTQTLEAQAEAEFAKLPKRLREAVEEYANAKRSLDMEGEVGTSPLKYAETERWLHEAKLTLAKQLRRLVARAKKPAGSISGK